MEECAAATGHGESFSKAGECRVLGSSTKNQNHNSGAVTGMTSPPYVPCTSKGSPASAVLGTSPPGLPGCLGTHTSPPWIKSIILSMGWGTSCWSRPRTETPPSCCKAALPRLAQPGPPTSLPLPLSTTPTAWPPSQFSGFLSPMTQLKCGSMTRL